MTFAEFSNVFAVLALQLRCSDADAAMAKAYFQALKDLDLELVQMAAVQFSTQPGDNDSWFPKTAEWRAMVGKITVDRKEALKARLRALPAPLCLACEDTGWAIDTAGAKPCACREMRRLEVLGRRPWPQLPEDAGASQ